MYQFGSAISHEPEVANREDAAARMYDDAWRALEECRTVGELEPEWYVIATRLLALQGRSEAADKALVFEGISRYPNYYELYFAGLEYVWYDSWGDKGRLEEFAQFAVRNTVADEGTSLYARLYWYASQIEGGLKIFFDRWPNWPTMKVAIHDVIARYPDNWNVNNFARFACAAGDSGEAKSLIDQMEWPIIDIWKDPDILRACSKGTQN